MTRILAATVLIWCVKAAMPLTAAGEAPPPGAWQEAPAYLPLFAPSGPRAAAYRIYVSRLGLDAVLKGLKSAWMPSALLPSDAFGQTGGYDRSKLARLYGSTRALVARGPRGSGGRPTEAWTLISPYPARDLDHLEPGTMLIVLNLAFP